MAAQALTDMARGVGYPGPLTGTLATRAPGGLKVRATARKASIAGLIAAMALGSVALWTVVPVAVLWLTPAESFQPVVRGHLPRARRRNPHGPVTSA